MRNMRVFAYNVIGASKRRMRLCLLTPPPEADQAARLLDAAADAILDRRMEIAAELLQKADIRQLHAYAASVMSPTAEILGFEKRLRHPRLKTLLERSRPRMPTGADAQVIFKRDGHRCRYCGIRVVRPGVRSLLTGLFPDVVRWPGGAGGDRAKHAAFFALNGVLDHVEPYARGGDSSVGNIVTACWPCNFGKEDHSLEELGLHDPRLREPVLDKWDGLDRLVRNRVKPTKSLVQPKIPAARAQPEDASAWLSRLVSTVPPEVLEALRDLIVLLGEVPGVSLSVRENVTINVAQAGRRLSILSISSTGDVDVPWLIDGEKDWFKPFAENLTQAIPEARLYQTKTMWRVDGCGAAKGQITIDELVGASAVVLEGVKRLSIA